MPANHVVLGTGAIGRAIMMELTTRGESVRMVNRSGKMDEVPAGVEVVASDVYDPAKVREVTLGAKVVYQASQPEYTEWVEKFPAMQQSIIDGLTGGNAKLVIVENLYMYGDVNGTPITEYLPHNAHTRKGKVRGEISNSAFEAHRAGKVHVTSARGSDFFGPWGLPTAAMGERTFYPMLHGKAASLLGNIDLPHTHTYVPDFGKALVILGERSEADGQAWHVPNDNPQISQREMAQMIADEMGLPLKVSAMGKTMMWVGGLFIPVAKETVEMMYEFEKPFIVDSSRFESTFGMKATPMKEAIKETVAWYKSHPEKK
ncbi:MAG: NAD(P)H-binding protein [Anaerolineales bacterium]|jgi:nucleoside-diphosphate-sugar epimerase|nr:NAD(P)H-binding protein [Chloroflexota bacterium]MBK6646123.1 NAD(P)H-binding protein [Anaerolineales bacterium]MCC6568160.1 NAD(P)H-binding protein [Anaerolineales bacterium]